MKTGKKSKKELLNKPVKHIDFTSFDTSKLIDQMKDMGFTARSIGKSTSIFQKMLEDSGCTIILTLAGSTSAAGCIGVYSDLVKHNMVDVVVATGASIVDMDFFEALGFKHYQGEVNVDDRKLRELYVDRIYDTYINEKELQVCDRTITEIANKMEPNSYSSREFIQEMGRYLKSNSKNHGSLVEVCYKNHVPIFSPAFSDSSAGLGLVMHQVENPERHISIDSIKDFRELTKIKIESKNTGLIIIGGGVPKNFSQDTVICAEVLGQAVPAHKYAIQITVADVRDGALSSSTLKEAQSWGKVSPHYEQMVYAEATSVIPMIASYLYNRKNWKKIRKRRNLSNLFLDPK